MALPLSPSTSYIAGSVPPVHADDLNALQVYLAGLYSGQYTVKSLQADGTGGAAATLPSGLLRASGLVTHTTTPAPVNYPAGTVAQGTVARGWAVCSLPGVLARGYKVLSVAPTSTFPVTSYGDYTITFDTSPSDTSWPCPWAVSLYATAPRVMNVEPGVSAGKQTLRVRIFDLSGSLNDASFACGFFGE